MTKEEILELEIRRRIYAYIEKSPGLHERELARELQLPLSTLDYHLYHLKKRNLIVPSSDGKYTRYYTSGKIGVKEKNVLAVLRQAVPRKIVLFLLLHPHSTHNEICDHIALAPSTISFHLGKLVDIQVIDRVQVGRENQYVVKEPEYVSDLLITYQKSFLDDAVDRFLDTWLGMHPHHLRKKKEENNTKNDTINFLLFLF